MNWRTRYARQAKTRKEADKIGDISVKRKYKKGKIKKWWNENDWIWKEGNRKTNGS